MLLGGRQFLGRFGRHVLMSGRRGQGVRGLKVVRGGHCDLVQAAASAVHLVEHAVGRDLQAPSGTGKVLVLRYHILDPSVP